MLQQSMGDRHFQVMDDLGAIGTGQTPPMPIGRANVQSQGFLRPALQIIGPINQGGQAGQARSLARQFQAIGQPLAGGQNPETRLIGPQGGRQGLRGFRGLIHQTMHRRQGAIALGQPQPQPSQVHL